MLANEKKSHSKRNYSQGIQNKVLRIYYTGHSFSLPGSQLPHSQKAADFSKDSRLINSQFEKYTMMIIDLKFPHKEDIAEGSEPYLSKLMVRMDSESNLETKK